MAKAAQAVSGYWREIDGRWRWIKPYVRYTGAAATTPFGDASAPTHDPPPGEVAPETLIEFGHLLEREQVTVVDISRVIARSRRMSR